MNEDGSGVDGGLGGVDRQIAVIGMAGRFPGARDLPGFWRNLADGVEGVSFFSDEELAGAGVPARLLADPNYVKAGSLLDGVGDFDAEFFGYTAREAELLDPQQRLFLEHCWHALEDAGYDPGRPPGLIGVYAGVAWNTYLLSNLMAHRQLFDGGGAFQVFITNDKDFMPTRVSYKLNLRGPSVILQTSCSTSLVAVHLACLSLLNYECDMALVGGVTVKVPQVSGYYHQEGGLASPDGHCRAFDARAAGTIFGSGVGVAVLKRLPDALADGDRLRAVIRGSAINNDGAVKVSYTAPSVEGQTEVIATAQAVAGIAADSVQYVEAHGTGTSLGDPIEVTALTKVFRETTEKVGFCALGSVKSNVGHLDAAAGIAGFLKTVMALENRQIPPSLHYESPNPAIDFAASPFYVNTRLAPWTTDGGPRRAGVSSFGVGGTNAHVILEEAPETLPGGAARGHQLLLLSARTEAALDAATEALAERLENDPPALADVAFTLEAGRAVFRHRRFVVAADAAEAAVALRTRDPRKVATAVDREEPRDRPVVFMFSGQGAQYPGMGRELYDAEPAFREALDRSLDLLRRSAGLDLRPLLFPAPEAVERAAAELAETRCTQPALFAIEYALAELWKSWGVEPRALVGHSIGEYVAACLAGVFTLEDALALVARRGALMQALPPGAMLAVPLSAAEVEPLLGNELSLAAVNEPNRVVVSGPEDAVAALAAKLSETGVEARRLHTSHAFLSEMMEPILETFTAEVARRRREAPKLPILSNLSGTWLSPEEATDPAYWARHLVGTVQFARSLERLFEDPERVLLEVGPGRTLATLAGRHPARQGQPVISSLRHAQDEAQPWDGMLAARGRLWLAGVKLDPAAFFGATRRLRVPLPLYAFDRRRYWIEGGATPESAGLAAPGTATEKRVDLARWYYLPSFAPALPPEAGEAPQRWLVLAPENPAGAALVAQLVRAGREVVEVRPAAALSCGDSGPLFVRPGVAEDQVELLAALARRGFSPEGVIHAWYLGAPAEPARDVAGFERAQELGFHSLLCLVQAFAGAAISPLRLVVAGSGLLRLPSAEPSWPERSSLVGLCRVLPQELAPLACRVVDLAADSPAELAAERLLAEAFAADGEELVLLRGRQRYLPSFAPVELAADAALPLRRLGVYLLTGGLEGNGYAFARFLAREASARLVLLEAEPLPLHSEWPPGSAAGDASRAQAERTRRARALEALGAQVMVVGGELAAASTWAGAVAAAEERFGSLDGVIHAAGTVGERTFRTVLETGRAEAGWHFELKAHPLYALEAVLEARAATGRSLDFCVLLSSLASVLGGVAYASYAAANRFLEAFVAEHNRRSAVPWLALGWDLWRFEEESEQITELREDLAELAMTPREGEEAFRRALGSGVDHLLVSTADLSARLAARRERMAGRHGSLAVATSGPRHPRPQLLTPFAPPATELEERLVALWSAVLGFETIGVDDNFFEMGGDSFIAVQMVSQLRAELGIDVPVARLYQGLSVRALAELIGQDQTAAASEREALLEERRQSMSRRREFQQRRRGNRHGQGD